MYIIFCIQGIHQASLHLFLHECMSVIIKGCEPVIPTENDWVGIHGCCWTPSHCRLQTSFKYRSHSHPRYIPKKPKATHHPSPLLTPSSLSSLHARSRTILGVGDDVNVGSSSLSDPDRPTRRESRLGARRPPGRMCGLWTWSSGVLRMRHHAS